MSLLQIRYRVILSLALDDGRIVEIGAEANRNIGLGELLNFFSFQSLSHLSEVSKKGFPFDVMRGDFTIKNGNIDTQDTYWEGPVARVAMRGLISLPNRNYDFISQLHLTLLRVYL